MLPDAVESDGLLCSDRHGIRLQTSIKHSCGYNSDLILEVSDSCNISQVCVLARQFNVIPPLPPAGLELRMKELLHIQQVLTLQAKLR